MHPARPRVRVGHRRESIFPLGGLPPPSATLNAQEGRLDRVKGEGLPAHTYTQREEGSE